VAKQCKSNPKKFWKYVNSKSKSQTTIGDIKKVGSNGLVSVVNADEDKANVLVIILQGYTLTNLMVNLMHFHLDAQQTHVKM